MERDSRNIFPVLRLLLRDSFRQAFRLLPGFPGKQLVAVTAWAASGLAGVPLAFPRVPRNSAIPPTFAKLLARICRSSAPGRRCEGRLPRPAAATREWTFPFPVVSIVLAAKPEPSTMIPRLQFTYYRRSVIFHHCRYQTCRKIVRQPIQCRILL